LVLTGDGVWKERRPATSGGVVAADGEDPESFAVLQRSPSCTFLPFSFVSRVFMYGGTLLVFIFNEIPFLSKKKTRHWAAIRSLSDTKLARIHRHQLEQSGGEI